MFTLVYIFNDNFSECKDYVSLDNLQIQIFKKIYDNHHHHTKNKEEIYFCEILIKRGGVVKKIKKEKIYSLINIIKPSGLNIFPDLCYCKDNDIDSLFRCFLSKKFYDNPNKIDLLKHSKNIQKRNPLKEESYLSNENRIFEKRKKRDNKNRKRRYDNIKEKRQENYFDNEFDDNIRKNDENKYNILEDNVNKIDRNLIVKKDYETLKCIKKYLENFENPITCLPITLSIVFNGIFNLEFDVIDKIKKYEVLSNLQKIYPQMFN